MTENSKYSEMSDDELFKLVKAGQDEKKWSLGLTIEVERRGPEILDLDATLRADWDAFHEEQRRKLKAIMDASGLARVAETLSRMTDSNRVVLDRIAKVTMPSSFTASLLANLVPKFSLPKYEIPKLEIPTFDYPKLDLALRSDIMREHPDLETFPVESPKVVEATQDVISNASSIVGLLAQLVEINLVTSERVKPARWQFPIAIWTLVLTAMGILVSVVIAFVD